MAMLEIKDIHKTFYTYDDKPRFHIGPFPRGNARRVRSALHVLNGVDLSVEKGDVVAILGPSGSGKTTLLRCLNFLERPDTGVIKVNGETMWDAADPATQRESEIRKKRLHFGLVFQNFNLFPQYTALQNVMLAGELLAKERPDYKANKKAIHAELEAQARELLAQMGLSERANHYPHQLSGGQQQRVAIARSLVNQPRVLLLDEPLGALDLKLRKEMQLELKRLQREMNITFVYVTHDQEEALTMSDTVVVMNGGKVQQIGTPEDIYNEPKNAFVADFIGDSNIVDGVMHRDFLVSFSGVQFPCVDRGFAREQSVQVVVRPEDIEVVSPVEGQLVGVVNDVIFKGVHFEMHVECEGREWLIHSTRACTPGETIGMRIGPNEIHIMARSEG